MLDRILYRFASPLAREIIDSLRDEPGEWRHEINLDHSFGEYWTSYFHNGHLPAYFSDGSWSDGHVVKFVDPLSRLALRRAVNKWSQAQC